MQRIIGLLSNQYLRFRNDPATGERWFVLGLWWDDDRAIFINFPLPYIQRSQLSK